MKDYLNDYLIRTKNLPKSFLFILPLLVLYEVGIILYGSEVKNTADVIVKSPLEIFGKNAALVFNSLVIIISFCSIFYIEKKHRLHCGIFFPMLLESIIYALFLGYVIVFLVYGFLPLDITGLHVEGFTKGVIISLGAGVYEEIFFRLLLLSIICFVFVKVFKINTLIGSLLSILICAGIFSSMHYTGAIGDSFSVHSFLFRFVAGIILSAIFIFRGLGIAVYTHATYDVLTVFRFYAQ